MTTIRDYLLDYWHGLNKAQFAFVSAITAIAIWMNYKFDIEDGWIDSHYGTIRHFWYYFLLYITAMLIGYLSYLHDRESRQGFLSNPRFWGRVLVAVGIFSFYCYFHQYRQWLNTYVDDYVLRVFLKACADQVVQSSLMFLLVLAFWLWRDRKEQPLYGFRLQGVNIKPYLWLLAGMIPLVVGAGFFTQFTEYYPTARKILYYSDQLQPFPLYLIAYELCYGSEFFHIEFFFRGFLILAFARYAGIKAVLPVAVFYCFVHFGKPMGECISSYFGGIILGVLSYRTRSIAAGVMIHVGIAWMMELVAGGWYYANEHLTTQP